MIDPFEEESSSCDYSKLSYIRLSRTTLVTELECEDHRKKYKKY